MRAFILFCSIVWILTVIAWTASELLGVFA